MWHHKCYHLGLETVTINTGDTQDGVEIGDTLESIYLTPRRMLYVSRAAPTKINFQIPATRTLNIELYLPTTVSCRTFETTGACTACTTL